MSEVVAVSLAFPTVLFTFSLIVVVAYWLVVLVGAAEVEILDSGGGQDANVAGALLPATRAAKDIPVTIVLSLWIVVAWCVSAAATIILDDTGLFTGLGPLPGVLVLVAAPLLAWIVTVALVLPLGRLYRTDDAASHHDFIGATCVIQTADVSDDFGQAEVTSADGSSAIVQVRRGEGIDTVEELTRGGTALIFDYEPDGEYFYVTSFDAGPGQTT